MVQESKDEIEELIEKLNADSIEERTAAEAKLIEIGLRAKSSYLGLGVLLFLARLSHAAQGTDEHPARRREIIDKVLKQALNLADLTREIDEEIAVLEEEIKFLREQNELDPGDVRRDAIIKSKESRVKRLKQLKKLGKLFG